MKYFLQFLLAWNEFDLTLAKKTRRNPTAIAQLLKEKSLWEHELLMLELNSKWKEEQSHEYSRFTG